MATRPLTRIPRVPLRTPVFDGRDDIKLSRTWIIFFEEWSKAFLAAAGGEEPGEGPGGQPVGYVTLGTPSPAVYLPADASGGVQVRFTIPYEPPSPIGHFDRVHLYLQAYDDASKKATISDEDVEPGGFTIPETGAPDEDTSYLVPTVERKYMGKIMYDAKQKILTITDLAPNERQYWRVYAVSGSAEAENDLITAGEENETPNVVLTVDPPPPVISGAEWAPNAASFSLVGQVQYYLAEGGKWLWYATVTWTNPDSDPYIGSLAGYDLVVAYDDEEKTREVDASLSLNAKPHTLDDRNVPFEPENVELQLISYDRHGNRNTPVPGVTPTIPLTIQIPLGLPGLEYTPNIKDPFVEYEYTENGAGQPVLNIYTSFTRPEDASYGGVVVYAHTPEQPPIPPLPAPLTGIEWKDWTHSELYDMPADGMNWDFYFISADQSGRENSWQDGSTPGSVATPKVTKYIPAYYQADLLPHVTGFSVTYAYTTPDARGGKALAIRPTFTKPDGTSWSYIELWALREDGKWYHLGNPAESGAKGEAIIRELPSSSATWTFLAISNDVNGKDRDGKPDSDPAAPPAGTPSFPLLIDPFSIAAPLGNVTGFSVVAEYTSGDYYGRRVLLLYPYFSRPAGTDWSYIEFWAKREDGKWYHLGNPSKSGETDKAVVDSLPKVTYTWQFLAIANDVNGMDKDGKPESDPENPPFGSATFSLSIPAASGALDGTKIDGITAANFAAGVKPVELVSTLPALPSAAYPTGTPVYKITDTPPKLYRVDNAGTAWTPLTEGTDIIAHTITAGQVAAGAIGTTELFAGEILVGQGGGKPTRFKIKDSAGNMIGFWGDDNSIPFLGIFTTRLKIAPTVYATAPMIDCVVGGASPSITMRDVNLDIRYANSKLTTGPTVFDATYTSSVALLIEDTVSTEKSLQVTRGLVCFGSGLQVAALVKGSGNWGELVLYGPSQVLKLHLNANTGICRADGGFQMGGNVGVAAGSFTTADGKGVTVRGGLITQIV